MLPININISNKLPIMPETKKEVGKFNNYLIKDGIVSKGAPLFTNGINTCTAFVMSLGTKDAKKRINKMYHVAPENTPLKTLKDCLSKEVYNFYEENKCVCFNEDLDFIIFGGRELNVAPDSFNLYDNIIKAFEKFEEEFGARMSIICGKKGKIPLDEMYAQKDKMVLANPNMFDEIGNVKNPTREDLIDALENKYEIVEIHDEHKLNLINLNNIK